MRNLRIAATALAVGWIMLLHNSASGQFNNQGQAAPGAHNSSSQTTTPGLPPIAPDLTPPPQMEQDQAKMRNLERQKQIVSDTQKLLALANQLKEDVDKSNKDTLSLDVIRKADEIEKLAHSVKEKMKGS